VVGDLLVLSLAHLLVVNVEALVSILNNERVLHWQRSGRGKRLNFNCFLVSVFGFDYLFSGGSLANCWFFHGLLFAVGTALTKSGLALDRGWDFIFNYTRGAFLLDFLTLGRWKIWAMLFFITWEFHALEIKAN
jgi:hypothetical protein